MTTPFSNKPIITTTDISQGYVIRYFAQHISTLKITEIDKKQYDVIKNDPYHIVLQLNWWITGNANNVISNAGDYVYGVIQKNLQTINLKNKIMPGLERHLPNPLEYFIGVYN